MNAVSGGIMKADKETLDMIKTLMDDYKDNRRVNNMQVFEQPDTVVVRDILKKLIHIILPGYFRDRTYRFFNMESHLNVLYEDVVYNLSKQISIALRQKEENKCKTEEEVDEDARKIVLEFLKRIPVIREYTETDIEAGYLGDPAAYNYDEIVLSYPGFRAILINRIAHELYLLGVPLVPRIMTEYAHSRTGIDIHPGVTLGKYFFIDHGTGIVIGETAIIGEHVKVYQGVTIGALSTRNVEALKGKKRHPTIEDNVTIYSGASILGGETVIGEGATIGSNAFITKSVAPGAKVSIKNQELSIKDGKKEVFESSAELYDDSWFYII